MQHMQPPPLTTGRTSLLCADPYRANCFRSLEQIKQSLGLSKKSRSISKPKESAQTFRRTLRATAARQSLSKNFNVSRSPLDKSDGSDGRRGSGGTSRGNTIPANEIRAETEKLLQLDNGGAQVPMRVQGRTSSSGQADSASQTLFDQVPASVLNWETTRLMQLLLDNYEPDATLQEDRTSTEQSEEDNFLNALMRTEVMKELESFLKQKGYLSGDLRSKLKQIWFTLYKRAGRNMGSSGFEHVFIGELKGGKVSGFHNWLNFMKEEQEGDLDYKGYMKVVNLNGKGEIIKLRFDWLNEEKPVGSMFVGTTPELEIALYTLCFLTMPDANCPVQLAGHKFSIQTWSYNSRGTQVIGSAYPNI